MCINRQNGNLVSQCWEFVLGWVKNIAGKEENAGLPASSSFPTLFLKALHARVVKNQGNVIKVI